jgi:hypothetical protein
MTASLSHIRRRLESEGERAAEYFAGLPKAAWEQQVYTTGSKWGPRQILAHFISSERAFKLLIENIVAGGRGAPRDFNIDDFNETETPPLSLRPIPELIDEFRRGRRTSLALAAGIRSDDLDKSGYHPWFGETSLREMLQLIYRHNLIHLRDVRRAVETGAPVPDQDIIPLTASDPQAQPGG